MATTEKVLRTDDEISNAMLILLRIREKCEDDEECSRKEKVKAINIALDALGELPISS